MARFDVHARLNGPGYLLDCQADLLNGLSTRFVVPLLPLDDAPKPAERLNPIFTVNDEQYVMVTQFAAAIPVKAMGAMIGSLSAELGAS